MDYVAIVYDLIAGVDLDAPSAREAAYARCIEYAREHLGGTRDENPFLAAAADRLGQPHIVVGNVKYSVEQTGEERLHLAYSPESGPVLTGNRPGLKYLAAVIDELSESRMAGDHVHLYYGEKPLFGSSFPLTIYVGDDDWFDRHAESDEQVPPDGDEEDNGEEPEDDGFETREIDPETIVALEVDDRIPPPLVMTQGKVYRVLDACPFDDQNVWCMTIRDDESRLYVFTVVRDDGERQEIAIDLDHPVVRFFSALELAQFLTEGGL